MITSADDGNEQAALSADGNLTGVGGRVASEMKTSSFVQCKWLITDCPRVMQCACAGL